MSAGTLGKIIVMAVSLVSSAYAAQAQEIPVRFNRLTLEDGLPNPSVLDIIQDDQGFMWFGTFGGVVRYDGYRMETYHPGIGNPDTLPVRNLPVLYNDPKGRILLGYVHGPCRLYRYDPASDRFQPFLYDTLEQKSLIPLDDGVSSLLVDSRGRLLIGTMGIGLLVVEGDSCRRYAPSLPAPHTFPSADVLGDMAEDEAGNIWMPTPDGLCKWAVDGGFELFRFSEDAPDKSPGCLTTLFQPPQTLWVGTQGQGLIRFDTRTETFTRFLPDPADPYSISSVNVDNLALDREGRLWLSTEGSDGTGLEWFDPATSRFESLKDREAPGVPVDFNALFTDQTGNVWGGAWQEGIYQFDPIQNRFFYKEFLFNREEGRVAAAMSSLCEASDGELWIGTMAGKLISWKPFQEDYSLFNFEKELSAIRNFGGVWSITEDAPGHFWIGASRFFHFDATTTTLQPVPLIWQGKALELIQYWETQQAGKWVTSWGGGLCRLEEDPLRGVRVCYTRQDSSLLFGINGLVSFEEDEDGNLWMGVNQNGLYKLDPGAEKFSYFLEEYGVHDIHFDPSGVAWLATHSSGLKGFDPRTGQLIHLEPEMRETIGQIKRIVADDAGLLWMRTPGGLVQFDPLARRIRRRISRLNWADKETRGYSRKMPALKSRSGHLFFGGPGGILYFHPDSLYTDEAPTKVALTEFQLFNEAVRPGPEGPLTEQIATADRIVLSHRENDIAFRYAALHFKIPEEYRYRYKLEPQEDAWVEAGARNVVYYTNLSPGRYTFRVKAANAEGGWSEEEASVVLVIRRPWWGTPLAWGSYLALFVFAGIMLNRYMLRRRLQAAETRRLQELDALKTRLYTNITHEFRTPLTLILGLADQLKKGAGVSLGPQLGVIERNGQQLLRLVNQMLDLAKLDMGKLQLKPIQGDVIPYLKYLFNAFQSPAGKKKIRMTFDTRVESLPMDFDPGYLQQVIMNLLSNALKFTPAEGEVKLTVTNPGEKNLLIEVRDTGRGIAPGEIDRIFDRFYQVDTHSYQNATRKGGRLRPDLPYGTTAPAEGTGIGLAVTRELVQLMGGRIEVESEPGKGSTFSVYLPVTRMAPSAAVDVPELSGLPELSEATVPLTTEPRLAPSGLDRPLILVVEDNADVRDYLRSCLQGNYRIREAADGREGFEKAGREVPDLVISDVMMPEMDGFALCRQLKAGPLTSHIPVILLTAKADVQSKLEGLELGAEAYLPKPFLKEELLIRVRKLLELRSQLQATYQRWLTDPESSPLPGPDPDQAFVLEARRIVVERMTDESLDVPGLARAMGVSRTQLHRKLTQLTGQSAGRFIRLLRLQRARKLLKNTSEPISAIAYQCGFTDANHFSRLFKQEEGQTPTEFRENQ